MQKKLLWCALATSSFIFSSQPPQNAPVKASESLKRDLEIMGQCIEAAQKRQKEMEDIVSRMKLEFAQQLELAQLNAALDRAQRSQPSNTSNSNRPTAQSATTTTRRPVIIHFPPRLTAPKK